jgi:hypothetical protein
MSANPPEHEIPFGEFFDVCSKFASQHGWLLAQVGSVIVALLGAGYYVGQAMALHDRTDAAAVKTAAGAATVAADKSKEISANLTILSDTTQSSFDREVWFLNNLTKLLQEKGFIKPIDMQRLITGLILEDDPKESQTYEKLSSKLREKFRVTRSKQVKDVTSNRGIVFSAELDERLICEVIVAVNEVGLSDKINFIDSVDAPHDNNNDLYSIQVNVPEPNFDGNIKRNGPQRYFSDVRKKCGG